MAKGWIAQDYYNEYLELKEKILDIKTKYNSCLNHLEYFEKAQAYKLELDSLIERLRYVLDQLKISGVDMTDLVLLSAGVEINLFG